MTPRFSFKRHDGYRFDYNGSLTVNIYNGSGQNIDCFTLRLGHDYSVPDIVGICSDWEMSLVT